MLLHGTISGSPSFPTGVFGTCLSSTSDTSFVTLPAAAWPDVPALTVEAWLKITGNNIAVAVSTEWWMGLNNTGNFATAVSGAFVDSGIRINDGNWHHCALVVSLGILYTYVDGVPGNSAPISYVAPTVPAVIGKYAIFNNYPWTGSIDEVAMWGYAKYCGPYTVPTAAYNGSESYLRALYHLDGTARDSSGVPGVINVPFDPSHPAILYSPFNWNVAPGLATTINAGAYFRTLFSGTSFTINTNTSSDLSPYTQFWVRIDGQSWVQWSLAASSPALLVASTLQSGLHSIEVVVKSTNTVYSRWYNAQVSFQITGFLLDAGGTLTAPIRRSRNILIFGDSITEGTNAVNTLSTVDVDRADSLGCYSLSLATAVDAEIGVVAFAGTGVLNYGRGGVPPLTQSFNIIFPGVPRSFTAPFPDLVIYNEGTNDTGNIAAGLIQVITAILQVAPQSRHLVLNPFNGTHAVDLQSVVTTLNRSLVTYQNTTGWFNPVYSVDGVHPYNYAHLELIAPKLYPVVSAIFAAALSASQYAFH